MKATSANGASVGDPVTAEAIAMRNRSVNAQWPAGKRLAVLVNVALEGWSQAAAPAIGPMGNPLPNGALDLQAQSWADYGPRRGMRRLLGVLARAGVNATVMASGVVAERYPELLAAVATAGHEICGHGYAQELIPAAMDEPAEWDSISRSLQAIEAATGSRPIGWISPRCTPSPRTARLLAAAGLRWHADVFDDDLPRQQTTDSGPIIAIPFTMEINDLPLYVRHGQAPEQFTLTLRRILEGWFANHDDETGCIDITVHAHVFGRPFGAEAFEMALDVVRGHEWAWTPTHATLAECCTTSVEAACGPGCHLPDQDDEL